MNATRVLGGGDGIDVPQGGMVMEVVVKDGGSEVSPAGVKVGG